MWLVFFHTMVNFGWSPSDALIIRWHQSHVNYRLQEWQRMLNTLVLCHLMYILMKWTARFLTGISNFEIVSSKFLIRFGSNEICFIKWWNLCHKLSLKEECFLKQYIFPGRNQILKSYLMGSFCKSNQSYLLFDNFCQLSKKQSTWHPKYSITWLEGKSWKLLVC